MLEISVMTRLLTAILLICGYLALIQVVNAVSATSYYAAGNTLLIDIIVGILYLVVCAAAGLLYICSGCDEMVLYTALGAGVLIGLGLSVRFCLFHSDTMRKRYVVLFGVYFLVVLYLTVFMRIGSSVDTSIVTTPFDDLRLAVERRDPELIWHMLCNIGLFLPFGYLIPAMNPEYFRKASFSFLGGLMASTVIEGIQMIFSLGQCDIDDIIANSIGAVLGYLAVRFVWQFQKNWRL